MNAFSHLKQFYVCKVLRVEEADANKVDGNGHEVVKGDRYFVCNYLTKVKKTRGKFVYKMQNHEVFVLPSQVLSPFVDVQEVIEELFITATDYQVICDEMLVKW